MRKIRPERPLEITSGVLEALDYSHRAGKGSRAPHSGQLPTAHWNSHVASLVTNTPGSSGVVAPIRYCRPLSMP